MTYTSRKVFKKTTNHRHIVTITDLLSFKGFNSSTFCPNISYSQVCHEQRKPETNGLYLCLPSVGLLAAQHSGVALGWMKGPPPPAPGVQSHLQQRPLHVSLFPDLQALPYSGRTRVSVLREAVGPLQARGCTGQSLRGGSPQLPHEVSFSWPG